MFDSNIVPLQKCSAGTETNRDLGTTHPGIPRPMLRQCIRKFRRPPLLKRLDTFLTVVSASQQPNYP